MNKQKHNCDLKSCFFCTLCLKQWLPAVAVHRKTMAFRKGELLFREGEPVKGIYFLKTGKAKVHKKWGEDKELIVRFAGEGDIVGHRGLGNSMVYPVSATALEAGTVCFIDLDFFLTSLKVNHDLLYQLLLFYTEELQESERKMRNLAHMPVKGRIAYALLKLKERFGVNSDGFLKISISRQDIASYAGTTYETTFRTLSELVLEGYIRMEGKLFSVMNTEALLALVNKIDEVKVPV
ncbi:MAG: Crp/Fnr family transcriptional regulator [Bacteroidota bacterium]|nr:Crp/Fnr family transcriptional regulator [Bacteroidota bacterium]